MRFCLCVMVLLCICGLAPAQYDSVEWRPVDGDQIALYLDGVQAGNLRISEGLYYPKFLDGWGDAQDPPVDIPEQYRKKVAPSWQGAGIKDRTAEPGVSIGGDTGALEKVKRQADAAEKVQVPAFQHLPSITVISADPAKRKAILADFESNPALAQWKDYRVTARDPSDPLMAPFKLSADASFTAAGVAILYQPVEDANGQAPVVSIYGYADAAELAGKLRDATEEYDPNNTSLNPWTRTHVGVGVGLGVTCLFSVVFGGLLKWAR